MFPGRDSISRINLACLKNVLRKETFPSPWKNEVLSDQVATYSVCKACDLCAVAISDMSGSLLIASTSLFK